MRTGTLVLALVTAAAAGAGAALLLSGSSGPWYASAVHPAPAPSDEGDGGARTRLAVALAERDEARAEAESLRRDLERERKARGEAARPLSVAGIWLHSSDDGPPTTLELKEGGEVIAGDYRARWWLEGRTLRMSWPAENAPGGSWEDVCAVSEDLTSYAGRNQTGTILKGTRKSK